MKKIRGKIGNGIIIGIKVEVDQEVGIRMKIDHEVEKEIIIDRRKEVNQKKGKIINKITIKKKEVNQRKRMS